MINMELDEKTAALVAIGTSVGANCQPCLQYHVAHALGLQIGLPEIQAAIQVGRTVRKGAAYKMDQCIANLGKEDSSEKQPKKDVCGCGCGGSC